MTSVLLQISCGIPRSKNFENWPTCGKVMNENLKNIVAFFMTHYVSNYVTEIFAHIFVTLY